MLLISPRSVSTALLISLCLSRCALARFAYPICCSKANNSSSLYAWDNQTLAYLPLLDDYTTCDQTYNASIPPAVDAYIPYHYCKGECAGFQLSQANQPGAWAAPVVQFILPSIIFSMSIPRRTTFVPTWKIELRFHSFLKGFWSLFLGLLLSIATAMDTLIWVALILTLAGPMMVSGLHEALLDFQILRALSPEKLKLVNLDDASKLKLKVRLIVTVVCGNLLLHDDTAGTKRCPCIAAQDSPSDPLLEIPEALERLQDHADQEEKLLNLMSAQGDFGALVGAPVVFYLGGFIYTILDLLNDPSVQDAAISLAFGVEWMIVVHVAIISGCLLASNNPSAVSVLAGQTSGANNNIHAVSAPIGHQPTTGTSAATAPPLATSAAQQPVTKNCLTLSLMYETRFQPVSMWQRGSNKAKWLKAVTAGFSVVELDPALRIGRIAYSLFVLLPTVVLISLPPAAGAVVAWKTPPVGWGCRSLTLVCYAGCQLLVVLVDGIRSLDRNNHDEIFPWVDVSYRSPKTWLKGYSTRIMHVCEKACRWSLLRVYVVLCILSLFTALGGTMMQIMGVYKNCFCYVTAGMWLRLSEAFVEVASDTLEQRNSSQNWIWMGGVATVFMGLCSYIGWFYQRVIRVAYELRVKDLYRNL